MRKPRIKIELPNRPFCEGCGIMRFPTITINDGLTCWCIGCADAQDWLTVKQYNELMDFEQQAIMEFEVVQTKLKADFYEFQKNKPREKVK